MKPLQNFSSYCAALNQEDEGGRYADLIRYARNWLIDIQSLDEGKDELKLGYVSNYEIFLSDCNATKTESAKDELTRIVGVADSACRHIGENFRSKILRENVLMPSYLARELGSAGLSWLSRRSGRNIREKLAYTNNKLLAVKRRLSLDTGENRLFMAFVRRMVELIELKANNATTIERRFYEWGRKLLRDDSLSDIGHWENTAPNNTLLSDKNYRAVWRAWQSLEKIDDLIAYDVDNLAKHICTVFYWKLLSKLTSYCKFCVQPVPYSYAEFNVTPYLGNHAVGLSNKGYVTLDKADSCITITQNNLDLKIQFVGLEIVFIIAGREVSKCEILPQYFDDIVKSSVEILFAHKDKLPVVKQESCIEDSRSIYVDVFAVHPRYLTDSGVHGLLARRIVWQIFGNDYELSADETTALYISPAQKLYSVRFALLSKSGGTRFLPDLVRMIGKQIKAPRLSIPLPDAYSVFQLAPLRQAIHMHYKKLNFVPQSIATLIYAVSHSKLTNISAGDFVLVIDYVYSQVAVTMIQSKYAEAITQALPETFGLVWERHPTVCYNLEIKDVEIPGEIVSVFGEEGLSDEENILSFDLISHWLSVDSVAMSNLRQARYNADIFIQKFIADHRDILSGHRVYGILTSPVIYADKSFALNIPKTAILEGLRTLTEWEKLLTDAEKIGTTELPPIWSEHLPALAIKRLYGSFTLIGEGDKVEPLLDKPQKIHIAGTFTLPRGQKEYHFGLIMGNDKNVSYEAALRNRAFPLKADVECELNLTYTYGRDNPYELYFVPKQDAPFAQIKAAWEPISEYPYNNLPYPKFPAPSNSWQALENNKRFSKKANKIVASNFLEWIKNWVERSFEPNSVVQYNNCIRRKSFQKKNGWVNYLQTKVEGYPAIIRIDGDAQDIFADDTGFFSCQLNVNKNKRYLTSISKNDWFCANGNWMCIKKGLNIDGEYKDIAFFPNQFMFEEDFFVDNLRVSFSVFTTKNGRYTANDILLEGATPCRFYQVFANKVTLGLHRYNLRTDVFYPLHNIYANGKTSATPDCPEDFKNTVQKIRRRLLPAFHDAWSYHDFDSMRVFFRIMCIMAKDIGNATYEQIPNVLTYQPEILDEDCGCALGDYNQSQEQIVLNAILGAKLSDVTVIGMLSKAAWKSDGFILNMSADILLMYYDRAINYLEKYAKVSGKLEKSALWCFEYILAVFRLREYKEITINRRLSLNDAYTAKLVEVIEEFIDAGAYLPNSRVRMDLHKSGKENKNIPRLMYAILVYINGGTDEIKITGISEEDDGHSTP